MSNQPKLFDKGNIVSQQKCYCRRCNATCKVDRLAASKAKMLKRSKLPKGLCVNCAVHDWLRSTYPVNLLLARSGPQLLALPHIQEQFVGIMKSRCSNAMPGEIDWQAIIDNWELPFPNKLKSSATNPVSQAELDREPEEERRRRRFIDERLKDPRSDEEIYEAKQKEAAELLKNAMRNRNENI